MSFMEVVFFLCLFVLIIDDFLKNTWTVNDLTKKSYGLQKDANRFWEQSLLEKYIFSHTVT